MLNLRISRGLNTITFQELVITMNELETLYESKLLVLAKYIAGFGLGMDDHVTADPWTPWPMP